MTVRIIYLYMMCVGLFDWQIHAPYWQSVSKETDNCILIVIRNLQHIENYNGYIIFYYITYMLTLMGHVWKSNIFIYFFFLLLIIFYILHNLWPFTRYRIAVIAIIIIHTEPLTCIITNFKGLYNASSIDKYQFLNRKKVRISVCDLLRQILKS